MRNIFFLLFLLLPTCVWAADEKFYASMQQQLQAMYQSTTPEAYVQSAQVFERIALAEPAQWEPRYYAAYSYISAGMRQPDMPARDLLLDQALQAIAQGEALQPQEFGVLKAWAYAIKISVDPERRGQRYSRMAMEEVRKVLKKSPDNPRALFIKGTLDYGTAQFFGSDTAPVCAQFQQALEKARSEQPTSPLAPAWAETAIQGYLSRCQ